jgi:transposase
MSESDPSTPKTPRKRGRPKGRKIPIGSTLLTSEIQDKVVNAVILGMPDRFIPALAGIDRTTYYDWLKRGARAINDREKGKPIPEVELPFVDFNRAVDWAMAQSVARNLKVIDRAAQGVRNEDGTFALGPSWQAAMTSLERRFPDDFGRKDRIEHSGDKEKPVEVNNNVKLSDLPDEDLRNLQAIARRARNKQGTGQKTPS